MFKCKYPYLFILSSLSFGILPIHANQEQKPPTSSYIHTDEEAFLIRRIAEFWKDGDDHIVHEHITSFLQKYPNSKFTDYFHGILGDIAVKANGYETALTHYKKIQEEEVYKKTLFNKLYCYYNIDQYQSICEEGIPYISSSEPEIISRKDELYFLIAEALFYQAINENDFSEKQSLAYEANRYYQHITINDYEKIVDYKCAELTSIIEQPDQAANAYQQLAKKYPEQSEEFLFQAGCLEAKYNNQDAINTFQQVQMLNGEKYQESTFNIISLLFEQKQYQSVIDIHNKFEMDLNEKQLSSYYFMISTSLFNLNEYEATVPYIDTFLDSSNPTLEELKNILLMKITCGYNLQDTAILQPAIDTLIQTFPTSLEAPQALIIHAMLLKNQGELQLASEKLQSIKEKYPDFEGNEIFDIEYISLAYENSEWDICYEKIKTFIDLHADSDLLPNLYKLLLSTCTHRYQQTPNIYHSDLFFSDLTIIEPYSTTFTSTESFDYSLIYSKIAYDLKKYNQSLEILNTHILNNEYSDHDQYSEACFIAALCSAEIYDTPESFSLYLEKAYTANPKGFDSENHILQLYNAYLSLSKINHSSETSFSEEHLDKAAECLTKVIDNEQLNIQPDNILWLANYYYNKASITNTPDMNAVDHSINNYKKILTNADALITITSDNSHLEIEIINFLKLLGIKNEYSQQLNLVTALINQQNKQKTIEWKFKNEAFYQLAKTYESLGNQEKALETYTFIHSTINEAPTLLTHQSLLQSALIHFNLIDPSLRIETNQDIIQVLNKLKELQIRKNIYGEPVHLEAALEYATIRSLICSENEKDEQYLFFLQRIEEDFNEKNDPVTNDYLVHLQDNPKANKIFEMYMQFINAEKLRIAANQLAIQELTEDLSNNIEQALEIYQNIKSQSHYSDQIYKRASQAIENIKAL